MSYQTIFKKLMALNETNSFSTYNDYYNMQVAELQELQEKLKLYQRREETGKLIVDPISLKREIDSPTSKKSRTLAFQSFDQVQNTLKASTSNNLELTKKECVEMLYQQALTLNDLAVHSNNTEEKAIYKQEIQKILDMIEKVKNYQLAKNAIPKTTINFQNRLVFLEQSNHRIAILEELQKEIPISLYPEFLTLLRALENGNFKKYKYLKDKSFDQVRAGDIRVYFSKLNDSSLLISSVIQKKFYTQKHYKEKLNRLENTVKYQKDYYLEKLSDEEFMASQEKIKNQIYTLLRKKEE